MDPFAVAALLVPLFALAPAAVPLVEKATVAVSPTEVSLQAGVRSGILTVENDRVEPVRVRLIAFAWAQGARGEVHLSPTTELVPIPATLVLAAGESRRVLLSPRVPVGTVENAYRIAVEEILADGNVRETASVPVFVEPPAPSRVPVITAPLVAYRTLSFALANPGSAHFLSTKVEVVGVDASGARVFAVALPTSHVLAGGGRSYAVDLPEATCRATQLEVRTETANARLAFPVARPLCAP